MDTDLESAGELPLFSTDSDTANLPLQTLDENELQNEAYELVDKHNDISDMLLPIWKNGENTNIDAEQIASLDIERQHILFRLGAIFKSLPHLKGEQDFVSQHLKIVINREFVKQRPRKGKRPLSPNQNDETVQTKNRFEAISDTVNDISNPDRMRELDDMDDSPQTTDYITPAKTSSVPPIVLRDCKNWLKIAQSLRTLLNDKFTGKKIQTDIKLQTSSPSDFRTASRFLDEHNIPYHTFLLPEDKLIKAVIRNLPADFDTNLILDELTAHGLPVEAVNQLKYGPERTPLPLFLVHVRKGDNAKKIFELTELFYLKVQVEPYRHTKGPIQCHRCQAFNHTARCCRALPKCLKCAEEHLTSSCSKTREDGPAKCANCEGPHPANYKGCPKFPSRRSPPQISSQQPHENFSAQQVSHSTSEQPESIGNLPSTSPAWSTRVNWSEKFKTNNQQPSTSTSANPATDLFSLITKLNLPAIIETFTTYYNKFNSTQSTTEKLMLVVEGIQKLSQLFSN